MNENEFHNKSFAFSVAFIMRFEAIGKWPIDYLCETTYNLINFQILPGLKIKNVSLLCTWQNLV